MKFFLTILTLVSTISATSQRIDSCNISYEPKKLIDPKPEILSGGYIDIVQNGQMSASARLFRLYIGEPGKLQMPVSVYTGVSSNSFSNAGNSDDVLLTLIDPTMGIFNLSIDGNNDLIGRKAKVSKIQVQYQAGLRFVSIYSHFRFINSNFLNSIYGAGLNFFTAAWEKDRLNNLGIFWMNFRLIHSRNPAQVLDEFFSTKVSASLWAYSIGMGIEISQSINVKIFYFRFLNNQKTTAFTQPFVQLSMNYNRD